MSTGFQWETLLGAYRQTTLMLVELAMTAIYGVNGSKRVVGVYMEGIGFVERT